MSLPFLLTVLPELGDPRQRRVDVTKRVKEEDPLAIEYSLVRFRDDIHFVFNCLFPVRAFTHARFFSISTIDKAPLHVHVHAHSVPFPFT